MRLAILSNVNLDMLSGLLKKEHEIFQTDGYGKWITYALCKDEKLSEFAPECLVLLLDGNALLAGCSEKSKAEQEMQCVSKYAEKLAEQYPDSYLAVSSIDIIPERVRQGDAADMGFLYSAYWDGLLTTLAEKHTNIHRFELRRIIEDYGRSRFYSAKFWYMGSIPYEMAALYTLAEEIKKMVLRLRQVRKKVLVLDLDNTLWGGVVGEDGPEGIILDSAHQGAIYQDAQKEIKKMQCHGIILAIASKNNREDVEEVFEKNPHMILKKEDFVMICADWNPKSANVKKIAEELNLALDSFVFIDDNEAERAAMRIEAPQVAVPEFPPDLTSLAAYMKDIYETYFWSFHLTGEDAVKTQQYQQERQRKEEYKAASSFEDYLRSLDTKIRLTELKTTLKERAVQLMNKTNQFNTCTLRMDEAALERYLREKQGHIIMAEVSDKYGNSGWVLEFLYHMEGNAAVVDNFLMSCRVMGRLVEHAVVDAVLERFTEEGIEKIKARYVPSAKNKPVEQLWDNLGFELCTEAGEKKEYELKLNGSRKAADKIHTVIWEEESENNV